MNDELWVAIGVAYDSHETAPIHGVAESFEHAVEMVRAPHGDLPVDLDHVRKFGDGMGFDVDSDGVLLGRVQRVR